MKEYVFKKYGAYGPAYFALIATGENTWYSHYHKNTRPSEVIQRAVVRMDAVMKGYKFSNWRSTN